MRGRNLMLSLGVGMVMMGSSGLAHADPPGPDALPISVVSVKTDDADDQADALTQAIKAEVRKLKGWSLGEGDFSLEVLSLALRCPTPPDAACEVRIADQIKASRYVWGTLKKAPGRKVAGTLHLWTRDQGHTKADIVFADNMTEPNDDAMRRVASDALAAMTGGPPKGSVKVTAGEVNGQIFVDGEPSGAIKDGQATVFVAVGSHKIEVRAPGYASVTGDVVVRPNSSVGLTLSPTAEGQTPGGSSKVSTRKLVGYGTVVLGVGLGAVGLYSQLKVNSINNSDDFNTARKVPNNIDICDAADNPNTTAKDLNGVDPGKIKDGCSTAKTHQVLQFVFYGLGLISAGTGVYLLLTDKPKKEEAPPATSKVRLLPSLSPNGSSGRLDLVVNF
jgi:hypothetical protein